MIFFGWGRRVKSFVLDENRHLLATWRVFHIFWCPLAFNIKWHILTDKRSEDMTIPYEEVKTLFLSKSPSEVPNINIWQRYGLLFLLAGIVLFSLFTT